MSETQFTESWWRNLLGDGQPAMNFRKDVRVWSEMAVRDKVCKALEAVKAREEALTPLPPGDNRKYAIFITENGIFLSAHIGDYEEIIDSEKFVTPSDFLKRLAEHRAASEPPGEEGT